MNVRLAALGSALAIILAACGGGHGGHEASRAGDSPGMEPGDAPMDFGAPAAAADADRTIEIEALDSLEFDPSAIEVDSGEVVTFMVRNAGENDHEFVLGDEEFQAAHEEAMGSGDMEHGGGMAIELEPGETTEITWRFSEPGQLLFGCHEPGHYDGGMVGRIDVT
jgi:uncharacterized cupredoxin-like copper-binding protein